MKTQLAQWILDFDHRRDRAPDVFVDEYGFDDARYEEYQEKRNIAVKIIDRRHPYFRTRPEEKIPLPAEIGPILNEFFGLIPIPQEEDLGRECHCEFDLYTQNEARKKGWNSKRRLNRIVRSYASRDPYMRLGEQPS